MEETNVPPGFVADAPGKQMEVREIVIAWLNEHGYDGLCNDEDECGCTIGNFAPCGEMQAYCVAAYRHPGKRHGCDDWMMATPHDGGGGCCRATDDGADDE